AISKQLGAQSYRHVFNLFPELKKHKPDNASINSAWWWGDNSRASRLKVLNKLIKEIKPKQ
ncbi:hypothetical protein LCGC14_1851330, partial [marine sediment metagenome]